MATLEEKLAQAEEEYHNLMIGAKPRVVVDQNGERVEFTQASAGRLAQYIQSLKNQIAGKNPGPARAWF